MEKNNTCKKHDYVFDGKVKTAVLPHMVYGVCAICGKQISVPYEEYEESYSKTRKDAGDYNE